MKTLGCLFSRSTVLKTEMLLRLAFASFSATRILPSYQELGSGVCHRVLVKLHHLRVLPEIVVAIDPEPAVVQEVHDRVLNASAAVDHLQERPLRVATAAEQTIDLLDLDRDVDARFDHRAVEEHIDVLQRLVDVLERQAFCFAAVGAY